MLWGCQIKDRRKIICLACHSLQGRWHHLYHQIWNTCKPREVPTANRGEATNTAHRSFMGQKACTPSQIKRKSNNKMLSWKEKWKLLPLPWGTGPVMSGSESFSLFWISAMCQSNHTLLFCNYSHSRKQRLLSPFYPRGSQGSEQLSELLKVTLLDYSRARISHCSALYLVSLPDSRLNNSGINHTLQQRFSGFDCIDWEHCIDLPHLIPIWQVLQDFM